MGDEGGILPLKDVFSLLEKTGHSVAGMMKENGIKGIFPFPLLYIFGRSDGTVSVNGAMISPTEVSAALLSDPELVSAVASFRLSVEPDKSNQIRLHIFLELKEKVELTSSLAEKCEREITRSLAASNECFRSSLLKHTEAGKPVFRLFPFRSGLFEQKEGQIKENYHVP